ncbi:tape measure protein [Gilliamella sp. B14384G15]|uniref:tape measure protein n=1 Tax=unclassified Gilliamella TaxID=2685620 RepID=UPI0018DEAD45|nr:MULTISPECIES: tape measure protein [unclassified Gilliamella]MBI0030616.1 tape measure protein [Gilliamella sp. B14384G15]MBI0057912.1 tape measure protein [Gilliamella sp. B14384G12]
MAEHTDGNITYTVSLEVQQLLDESKKVIQELKNLNTGGITASRGMNQLDASVKSAGGSLGKFTSIAKAVSAALISNTVFAYAQSWNELEDRIQNTGATASQTKDILDQLLATSDRNGRTIEESSELYIRLSNSMGELGYSTQSTLSYIDTLSNLLTINKTSSLGAESAINALTKAQMKGKLAGLEAMSVFNAMPSILKTLGKQLNKTETEVRKMATDGKLSMSQFTEAMIAAQEETAALADNMRNTVQDGINRVTNNLKKYLGELNNSTGATKLLVDSLILMSQHVDILMTGVGALAAVYAGKYITSLASATKQSVEKTIADMRQAQAEKLAAQAALQQAQAELANVRAAQQSLSAQLKLAQTEKTRNAIRAQLKANTLALTAATNAETAAQGRLNTAIKATSFAANGLRAAMAMLGGPAGIILLTAGALMTWSSKASEAKQKALELTDEIAALAEKYKGLSKVQKEAFEVELKEKILAQNEAIENQAKKITNLKNKIKVGYGKGKNEQERIANLNKQIKAEEQLMAVMVEGFNKAVDFWDEVKVKNLEAANATDNTTQKTKSLDDALKSVGENKIDDKVKSLSTQLEIAEMKMEGSKKAAYIYENALNELGDAGEEYKTTLRGLITGTIEWSKVSENVRKILEPLFTALGKTFDANERLSASNKKGRGATKSYADGVKELKDRLEVAKLEAKGLTVEAELLAITQKMGSKVTAQQTAELKKLIEASQAYKALGALKSPIEAEEDSFKQSKKSLDVLRKEGEIKTQEEYNAKLEQLERQHQINMAKIKSDAVVSDIDNAVAQVDPVLALENEHKRKLALIQEFETQKWMSEQNAIALREAANHQFEQNRINAQWEIWRNQSDANEFLASSLEGLASSATSTISGLMSGTMTATQAMQNFANVILNEAIGSLVQMGMQYVKNSIVAQSASAATTATQITEAAALAAAYQPAAMYASIATQGAAATVGSSSYITALGTMKAASIAGARKNGGSVLANNAYRVGEGGKPEILMQGGKQYLIPGENGRVLSNRQITSGKNGSSINLTINMPVNVGDSGGISEQDGQQLAKNLEQVIRAQIMQEQRPGGLLNRR